MRMNQLHPTAADKVREHLHVAHVALTQALTCAEPGCDVAIDDVTCHLFDAEHELAQARIALALAEFDETAIQRRDAR